MPKEKSSYTSIFGKWMKSLPEADRRNFKINCTGVIFCNVCSVTFKSDKKFQLDQHINTDKHRLSAARGSSNNLHQSQITDPPRADTFKKDLCEAFLASGIPTNKLDNVVFRSFLEKYINHPIPSRFAIQTTQIPKCYEETVEKIRSELKNEMVWVGMDETTDKCGRFMANVMVGALNGNKTKPHLLLSRELEKADNVTVTQLIMDAIHFLWPGQFEADISKKFLVFLSDGAPYMVKTGKNLKSTYPNLIHVTCAAHGLNRVAEEVRGKYNSVDKLLASIKAVFKKSPARIRTYKEMLPGLALPPEPVLTRWGTWLETVEFITANFVGIKSVIDSFDASEADCVNKAQTCFAVSSIGDKLAEISVNYGFLVGAIKKLESRNLSLVESVSIIQDCRGRLNKVSAQTGSGIKAKFEAVIAKNPDLPKLILVADAVRGRNVTPTNLPPSIITALTYCPITSVEIERSFSIQKAMLSDRRRRFTVNNLEMYLVCNYEINLSNLESDEVDVTQPDC